MQEEQVLEHRKRVSSRDIEAARDSPGKSDATARHPAEDSENDQEIDVRLRMLQEYICELLLENQQLRSLLAAVKDLHCEPLPGDWDESPASFRS